MKIQVNKTVLLGVAAMLSITAALAGCVKASPGKLCSSQTTYDNLIKIISASTLADARNATGWSTDDDRTLAAFEKYATPESLAKLVGFSAATVAAYDKETGKVECGGVLTVPISRANADAVANSLNLGVVSSDAGSTSFGVRYTAQPTVDGKQTVYELQSAKELGAMAVRAAVLKPPEEVSFTPQGGSRPSTAAPVAQPADTPTLGNCHMDSCSWSRVQRRVVTKRGDATIHALTLLGGSTKNGDEDPAHVKWNDTPHNVTVACSLTQPTVTGSDGTDELELNAQSGSFIPDVLMSAYVLYVGECHPGDTRLDPDALAAKYGYRAAVAG